MNCHLLIANYQCYNYQFFKSAVAKINLEKHQTDVNDFLLMFLLFPLNIYYYTGANVFIDIFEQVNVSWVRSWH